MKTVFCPNPACPRGRVRTASGGSSRTIGTCPDCGRTLADPEDLDRARSAERRLLWKPALDRLAAGDFGVKL